jgi:tripartite-type tricarboxylate transporter receptor subunit TctC
MKLMRTLTCAAAAAFLGVTATAAVAQSNYPTQPIRVLVPYVPGGATDYAARLVSERAKEYLGNNAAIVIENKAGAGGLIALEDLARSKPDGYTLMIGNVTTNSITPVIFQKRMSFDYLDKVVPVARLLITPSVFIANAKFAPNNWQEFIDYAKKHPGQLRAASTGIGAFTHFDLEMLQQKTGIKLIHVPYREGAGGAIQALVNGDVNVGSTNAVQAHKLRDSGQIKLYATNMTERIKTLPDVPTFAELGLPGHGTLNWSGVFAPAGTPPEIIKKLNEAFTKAVNDPWVIEKAGNTATFKFPTATQQEFVAFVKSEMEKWRKIAEEVKLEMN